MRRTLPGIFSFEYELPTPYNVSETPKSVDLENELPSVLQFEIGPNDIGGTLSVQLQLDHSRVSQIFFRGNHYTFIEKATTQKLGIYVPMMMKPICLWHLW